jgi:hypothetical protein
VHGRQKIPIGWFWPPSRYRSGWYSTPPFVNIALPSAQADLPGVGELVAHRWQAALWRSLVSVNVMFRVDRIDGASTAANTR